MIRRFEASRLRSLHGERRPRRTRLTATEQQTQLSLWAMARSPLIVGANLNLLDEETLRLLTNADVLSIDQTATASRQVLRDGDLVIWTADLSGNRQALAAFNVGEKPITVDRAVASIGLREDQYNARNAWTGERLRLSSHFTAALEPHASTVLIINNN